MRIGNLVSLLVLLTLALFLVMTGCTPTSAPSMSPSVPPEISTEPPAVSTPSEPSESPEASAPPAPAASPLAELNLVDEPLAEKRLNVDMVYSGGDYTGLCYLGAYAMLAKFADSDISFMDVVANSGIGTSALYIPQANILFGGSFLGSIGMAAKNQGFDYFISALKGSQITDSFLCPDFPDDAKEVIYTDSEEDAFNLLKRLISSDIPVEVHLDLFSIKEPMTAHTTWAGYAFRDMPHIDHYMTVTGYDEKNVYLSDPIERAPGKGKDIPVNISGFLDAWKNGNNMAFDEGSRVGPYWMLFLGKRGEAKSADELIAWNKDFAAKAPAEIRKAADNPNINELMHCNEMYRARKEFGDFMKQNGHVEAGNLFFQSAELWRGLCKSANKKADLMKIADLQEQALANW